MGLAAILARLRGPSRFAQLAADRHAYLSMLEQWPMVDPSEFYRMLEQLRVTHAEERLLQLVDLIAAAAIRLRLRAELPELIAQLRQISLSAEEAKALRGEAYGEVLNERRQAHLAHYLLDRQK